MEQSTKAWSQTLLALISTPLSFLLNEHSVFLLPSPKGQVFQGAALQGQRP
jgi:hypothetical protein